MSPSTHALFDLNAEEISLLAEMLESEQSRLLAGIRHSFHREYRDELRRRLDIVQSLIQRIEKTT